MGRVPVCKGSAAAHIRPAMSAALDPSRAEALAGLSVIQALFNAAQSGSLAAMQAAASVFPRDQVLTGVLASKRRSLLHVAALSGQTDIVRWLVEEKGFGVDSADEEGASRRAEG